VVVLSHLHVCKILGQPNFLGPNLLLEKIVWLPKWDAWYVQFLKGKNIFKIGYFCINVLGKKKYIASPCVVVGV